MRGDNKYDLSLIEKWSSTVYQTRLAVFQPTRRPSTIVGRIFESAHGSCEVTGRLGQQHADVLDAICSEHIDMQLDNVGRLSFLLDPYKLTKATGLRTNIIDAALRDIMAALVDLQFETDGEQHHVTCHIVDMVRRTESTLTPHVGMTVGERKKWVVTFSTQWSHFISHDIKVFYPVNKVAGLEHGISQAVARYVLSHRLVPRGGWRMDSVLMAVGVSDNSTDMRNRRRELRQDASELVALGIIITADDHINLAGGV